MPQCEVCSVSFTLQKNLNRHLREEHPEALKPENSKQPTIFCNQCDGAFFSQLDLTKHLIADYPELNLKIEKQEFDNKAGIEFLNVDEMRSCMLMMFF